MQKLNLRWNICKKNFKWKKFESSPFIKIDHFDNLMEGIQDSFLLFSISKGFENKRQGDCRKEEALFGRPTKKSLETFSHFFFFLFFISFNKSKFTLLAKIYIFFWFKRFLCFWFCLFNHKNLYGCSGMILKRKIYRNQYTPRLAKDHLSFCIQLKNLKKK